MKRVDLGGWAVWAGALLLVLTLPGVVWKPLPAAPFPVSALPSACSMVGLLALASPAAALGFGPSLARRPLLALLEAPPAFLWGGVVLALWPGPWGPPGVWACTAAFLMAALPGEVRWLCQALPAETPFPAAWGTSALRRARRQCLVHLLPRWLGARLPLWLTGAVVLERIFGVTGLGSDWVARVAQRDRIGLTAWVLGFALLWRISRPGEGP